MGLIDLKTDLKSLRYGKDTIGGGDSGQPYIQTPISENFNDLGANTDFILRGGINAARDAATDIKRLTKMFGDLKSPNGLLFIIKQNVLSNSAVRTQTSGVVNEGIYTPLNTLAQAGLIAFGGHLNKQGENPFELTGAYANNDSLYSVKVKSTQLIEENRLARLYQLISTNASNKLNEFTLNNGNVLTYNGGPNSILGVGKTNIRFSSYRTGNQNPLLASGIGSANYNYFTGSNGTGTPVYLSERKDIPNYISSFKGSSLIDTNNIANNPLLSRDEFRRLSPFVVNNSLVTSVIPENERKLGTGGSFILKSVDTSYLEGKGKQQGGLEINTELKPWIRARLYFDGNGKTEYSIENLGDNGLPSKNVNSPQSDSLSNIPNASTSIAPQNIKIGPNGLTYSKQINTLPPTGSGLFTGSYSGGVGNKYFQLTKTTGSNDKLVTDGITFKPTWNSNVYTQGNTFPENSSAINDNGAYTYNQQDIINQKNNVGKIKGSPNIQDFRKILRDSKNSQKGGTVKGATELGLLAFSSDYLTGDIGTYTKIGNPGQKQGKDYSKFNAGQAITALDKINASAIGTDLSNDDLVQFRIKGISGTNIQTLAFRAFLGSITDNYSATINAQQYVGRGENFYTYGGQSRKISLSWTVAALSRAELIPMYKRLSYLASMTAPIYNNGFMQGPLVSLTIGGYIYDLPGYIEGFSLEMAEDATWEIARDPDGNKDDTISQLTHVIKVSGFSFQPIPNYLPTTGANFISIVNPSGKILGESIPPLSPIQRGRVEVGPITIPSDSPDATFPN